MGVHTEMGTGKIVSAKLQEAEGSIAPEDLTPAVTGAALWWKIVAIGPSSTTLASPLPLSQALFLFVPLSRSTWQPTPLSPSLELPLPYFPLPPSAVLSLGTCPSTRLSRCLPANRITFRMGIRWITLAVQVGGVGRGACQHGSG